MEPRKDRHLSEVRGYQEFRNSRDWADVNDGNRRFKRYSRKDNMTGLIENRFGRKGKL
jgi:hypothetical protein